MNSMPPRKTKTEAKDLLQDKKYVEDLQAMCSLKAGAFMGVSDCYDPIRLRISEITCRVLSDSAGCLALNTMNCACLRSAPLHEADSFKKRRSSRQAKLGTLRSRQAACARNTHLLP